MRRQFELAQTALVRLSAERRFPRTPSRCVRFVCFVRRVHCACVCELPPLGAGFSPSPLGKVVLPVRRKRKGTVLTTGPLRVGYGVGWSSVTGGSSQHCAFLLGGRIPQTPCGAGGSFASAGESTARLFASFRGSRAGLGDCRPHLPPRGRNGLRQGLFLPLGGRWLRRSRRRKGRTVTHRSPRPVRCVLGTGLVCAHRQGCGSQHCAFLLGGRIPQTPCGAGGSFASVGESTSRLCASCRRSGAGLGDCRGTGPPFGGSEVHGAPRGLVAMPVVSCWRLAAGGLLHGRPARPGLRPEAPVRPRSRSNKEQLSHSATL